MKSLADDLQSPKENSESFSKITIRIIEYLPNIISLKTEAKGYSILSSDIAGTRKYARPIKTDLFIFDANRFHTSYKLFIKILNGLKKKKNSKYSNEDHKIINSVVYTVQQSIGVGLDFLSNPNSARKHVGNRFEELIRSIVDYLGVANKKVVFKIPYPTESGEKSYKCETDMIFSPHDSVQSKSNHIDETETIVSLKTSSKDRMGKIFLDKMLRQFAKKKVKVMAVFLNDVQRREASDIGYTFASGLFMVYTKFLVELEGVYFIDPPPKTLESPYNGYVSTFSKFILEDIWKNLSS